MVDDNILNVKMTGNDRLRLASCSEFEADKKKTKTALDSKRGKSKISIGKQMRRWNSLKKSQGFEQHHDVARLLLDSYEAYQKLLGMHVATEIKCVDLLAQRIQSKVEIKAEPIVYANVEPAMTTVSSDPVSSSQSRPNRPLFDGHRRRVSDRNLTDETVKRRKDDVTPSRSEDESGVTLKDSWMLPDSDSDDDHFSGYESLDNCYVTFADHSSDDEPKSKKKPTKSDDKDYLPSGCGGDDDDDDHKFDSGICDDSRNHGVDLSSSQTNNSVVESLPTDGDDDHNFDSDIYDDSRNHGVDLRSSKTNNSVVKSSSTDDGIEEPDVVKIFDNEYACTYCPQIRSNIHDAKDHILSHYEFHCQDCDQKFLTALNLKVHRRKHDAAGANRTVFNCLFSGCEYSAKTKTAVSKHIMARHCKETSYVCALCSCTTSTATGFTRHVMSTHYVSHRSVDAYRYSLCYICGDEFRRSTDLKEHMLYRHDKQTAAVENVGICDICGEVCRNKRVKWHKIMKHGEKSITCKFVGCRVLFKAEYLMENHYRMVHLGIKKFNCTYEGCSYSSQTNYVMKSHVNMVHLKNRSLPCPWPGCDKSFYHERHLLVHSRIHTNQKPYACDNCDYRCRQRTALNWHMKKKHADEVAEKQLDILSVYDMSGEHVISKHNTLVGIPAITHAKKPGRKGKKKTIF